MNGKKLQVSFGPKKLELNLLTIRQIQDIEEYFTSGEKRTPLQEALGLIRIALSRDHKDVVEGLDELGTTRLEVIETSRAILQFAEFVEQSPEGEWVPAGTAKNSGANSTAG